MDSLEQVCNIVIILCTSHASKLFSLTHISYVGVAITTGGYRPRPLTILSGLTTSELTTTIVKYVISERANNIVLGYPLNKNGTLSHQSSITKDFGLCLLQVVRQQCGNHINITLWDERYTSKEATSRIRAEAMARNEPVPSKSDLSTELDADAACIILEDYYKEMGINGEVIVIEDERIARECEEIYKQNIERDERIRKEMMEERERGRNARQLMIEKDRALEATKQDQNGGISSKKRKKKKKKKK